MAIDGQAPSAPETIDDLAQFLVDNPEADTEEESQPSEESQADNSEEQTEDAPAEDSEDSGSEDAKKPTSGLKFKVPVKGEDGADTFIEVDEKELVAGYQRHKDYTRKTMELGDKEREVTQVVAQKLEEGRSYYMQQAQLARATVAQLAGLKSPQEMAQLAQADPSAWVAEQQRQNLVHGVLAQLEQGMQREQQQSQAQTAQEMQQAASKAWGVLGQQGIDKPKLVEIYKTISEKYKIPADRVATVMDPQLVLIMRDAAAYQGLLDKKQAVTKKAKEAPALPAQRQAVPRNEQANKRLENRFQGGKAKLNDLAAYLHANNL